MNRKDTKIKIGLFLFWFVLITSFIFFAVLIQLKANGWKFDFQNWKLTKTGMVSLSGTPSNAEIKINNKIYSQTLPVKVRNLAPGNYDISVSSPGYNTWQKTIQIEGGKAALFSSIVLFFNKPQEATVPQDMTAEVVKTDFQNQSQGIKISGAEIFWRSVFVTRFSQDVSGAIIYPDDNHLIFQEGSEIRVIDIDGSNDQKLFDLSDKTPTSFTIQANGKTIYYLDQDKISGKNIN